MKPLTRLTAFTFFVSCALAYGKPVRMDLSYEYGSGLAHVETNLELDKWTDVGGVSVIRAREGEPCPAAESVFDAKVVKARLLKMDAKKFEVEFLFLHATSATTKDRPSPILIDAQARAAAELGKSARWVSTTPEKLSFTAKLRAEK